MNLRENTVVAALFDDDHISRHNIVLQRGEDEVIVQAAQRGNTLRSGDGKAARNNNILI